jgi:hypothetical protein
MCVLYEGVWAYLGGPCGRGVKVLLAKPSFCFVNALEFWQDVDAAGRLSPTYGKRMGCLLWYVMGLCYSALAWDQASGNVAGVAVGAAGPLAFT